MKATLKLEFIGADCFQYLNSMCNYFDAVGGAGFGDKFIGRPTNKPWIAEVGGNDPRYKHKRTFLRPNWDYSNANSKGSRGVYLWFVLESGKLYEVFKKTSWKNSRRYFCAVTENGDIYELDDKEAREWLNVLLESTS